MRSMIAGCALLLLGTAAAEAQPYYGFDGPPPPPPPGWGWHHRPPPDYGWRRPPYGEWRHHERRCWWERGYDGPRRVCRGW